MLQITFGKCVARYIFLMSITVLCGLARGNPTADENKKAGTSAWTLLHPALHSEIEGYASLTSVNTGGNIDLYVNTRAPSFNVEIYRMGYYGGAGGRLMQTLMNVPGQVQTSSCVNSMGVVECRWAVSATITVPAMAASDPLNGWTSGVYLAKLTANAAGTYQSYIIFVVRDDARVADFVAQLPVSTYQAYNYWGGKSLYTGCLIHDATWKCANGATKSSQVSFNRPYGPSSNPAAAFGVGAGEFITNVQPVAEGYPITSAGFDYNMVRWMERQGQDVKYVTSIDLHQDRGRIAGAKSLIVLGHDEYYSQPMRNNLTSSLNEGVNLAFFSSNEIYWKARFEDSAAGGRDRTMIVYKDGSDPITGSAATTGRFRDLGSPEASLIGSQYVTDPVQGDIVISAPFHWLYSGAGAIASNVLPGLLGYEINGKIDGVSPANTVVIAHSPVNGVFGDMTYYIAPSSAQVFATGSMQWAWGLDDYISNGTRRDFSSTIAKNITLNVFNAVGERDLVSFINKSSGLYLESAGFGSPVVQGAGSTGLEKNDAWRLLLSSESGLNLIVSRASGSCLDAYGSAAGSQVGTWECNGENQQKWSVVDRGGDDYALVDKRSGLCMQSPGALPSNAVLTLAPCLDDSRQKWTRVVWRSTGGPPPTPSPSGITAGASISITSALGPYLVGVASGQAEPVVQTLEGAGPGAVQWKTVASSDGAHLRVLAASSNLCLDAYGAVAGAVVGTWDCHGGANQDWLFKLASDGSYQIINRNSLECISIANGVPRSGGAIELVPCASVAAQRWKVVSGVAVTDSVVGFQNKSSGLFAAVPVVGPPAAPLVQTTSAYRWKLAPSPDPAYSKISSLNFNLCLDAYGSTPGSAAGTWACHGGDNQQWIMLTAPGSFVQLVDKRSHLCVSVPGGTTREGTELNLAACAMTDEQFWRTTQP